MSSQCGEPNTQVTTKQKQPRYVDGSSDKCGEFEIKGYNHPSKSVNSKVKYSKNCETLTDSEIITLLKSELNSNAPSCAIQNVNWNITRNQDEVNASASMDGINSL